MEAAAKEVTELQATSTADAATAGATKKDVLKPDVQARMISKQAKQKGDRDKHCKPHTFAERERQSMQRISVKGRCGYQATLTAEEDQCRLKLNCKTDRNVTVTKTI